MLLKVSFIVVMIFLLNFDIVTDLLTILNFLMFYEKCLFFHHKNIIDQLNISRSKVLGTVLFLVIKTIFILFTQFVAILFIYFCRAQWSRSTLLSTFSSKEVKITNQYKNSFQLLAPISPTPYSSNELEWKTAQIPIYFLCSALHNISDKSLWDQ